MAIVAETIGVRVGAGVGTWLGIGVGTAVGKYWQTLSTHAVAASQSDATKQPEPAPHGEHEPPQL